MIRKMTAVALVGLLAALALTATGCRAVRLQDSPDVRNESSSFPLGGATRISAKIVMGVGELRMSGESTTTDALQATFRFNPESWRPETSYAVVDGEGRLEVRQPSDSRAPQFRSATNEWDLVLAGGIPTDLDLTLGVGNNRVDLSKVDVRDLKVVTGVGEATLDLTGPRTADVDARVESGVGSLRIRLPRGVAVRVSKVSDGLGTLTADGFTLQGDDYVNAAYGSAGPRIQLDLHAGVGDVTLELVD